jgi:hypothetical protein
VCTSSDWELNCFSVTEWADSTPGEGIGGHGYNVVIFFNAPRGVCATIDSQEYPMPNIGPMIAASARLGLGYADRLLTDVTPDQFARFATPGGQVIESNHPAFIYGHLSLYAPRVVEQLGGDATGLAPSARFERAFSKDAKCVDDPDGSIYPAMDEIVAALKNGYSKAVETLESAGDELFIEANPNEAMRAKFATIGAMHGFYVGGHFMLHMGQMSAWRRAIGLGSA